VLDRRALTILALGAASALCVATVQYRIHRTGDPFYQFLVWNLFLAWVPLALAVAAYQCARRRLDLYAAALGALWVLFFPNAPYMLTDFIHLQASQSAPLWYDALMLSSFAWTGLLLGFASLYLMQVLWRRAAGPAVAWVGVVCALALASFGVYIGRFIRFNSWDALLRPERVADVLRTQLENPFQHPRLLGSLVVLTGFLSVAYFVLYSVAGVTVEFEREGRSATGGVRSPARRRPD
jgi:uncharacterized membrane protein